MSSSVNDLGLIGTANQVLVVNSGGTALNYGAVNVASSAAVTGALPVANGGTGDSSLTAYAVLCGGTTTTGAVQSIASVGTTGQVLTSNGASALPTFQAAGGGAVTKITTMNITSTVSTIAFTGLTSAYAHYILEFNNVIPNTNQNYLQMAYSNNNGSSYNGNDAYSQVLTSQSTTVTSAATTANAKVILTPSGSLSTNGISGGSPNVSGFINLYGMGISTQFMQGIAKFVYQNAGNAAQTSDVAFWSTDITVANAVQFSWGAGGVFVAVSAAGGSTIILYGVS